MANQTRAFLFAISLLFFQLPYASAQYYGEKDLSFGLSVSPNLAWLKFDNDQYTQDNRIGYSYGLVADIGIGYSRNYYFSTGLQINTLNHRWSDQDDISKDTKLQYAEVPLAIKLKTDGNHLGKFYGLFGFTAGIKVSSKEKLANASNYDKSTGADLLRLGLAIGAGAEWRVGYRHAFMTGITFNNGFTRALKNGSPKNPYLALNIGFIF